MYVGVREVYYFLPNTPEILLCYKVLKPCLSKVVIKVPEYYITQTFH